MKEADPRRDQSGSLAHDDASGWDVSTFVQAFDASAEPTRDLLFGNGLTFRLGPERAVELALYPEHRAVELSTPDVIVSFRCPSDARPLEEHVLFRAPSPRQETTLVVGRDGTASLIIQPLASSLPTLPLPDSEPDAKEAAES